MIPLFLLSTLQLCISFSVVAGDCYDKSFSNCSTCYQTFANALIDTGDNKYLLSKMFFSIDTAPPVQVKITYRSTSNMTDSIVWYWLMGGFYVFQPLELFLYRSLIFSPPTWRKEYLTVVLPDHCFSNGSESKSQEFFEYTTQRVLLYMTLINRL